MQNIGGEAYSDDVTTAEAEARITPRSGNGDDPALAQIALLEERVDRLIEGLEDLRGERSMLREEIETRDRRIRELESGEGELREREENLRRLSEEKTALLEDRARIIRRVETLIERLNQLGLE